MATIEKRTNGTYRVKVRKSGQHVSASFPTKRLAQQWARKVETELAENAHLPAAQTRKRTLGEWRSRLRANAAAASALVGEDVVQKYDKYLSLFMIGFHTGTMNLSRFAFRRIDRPWGR